MEEVGQPIEANTRRGLFRESGWVIGGIDDDKAFLLDLVEKTGCIVVDVGYRCAPEYKFPTGTMDCWEAYKWVVENADKLAIDFSRIAVG